MFCFSTLFAVLLASFEGFLFCGKARLVAACHRHPAKSRLSNPTLQISMPKKKMHPQGVHFFLAERVGFEPTDTRISPVFKTGAFNHSTISPYCPCHREGRKACGDPYPRRKSGFPCRCAPRNDKDFGGVYCNTNPAGGQSVFNREFCRKVRSRRCARRSPEDTGRCRRQRRCFRGHISCRWPADPAPFPPAG